MHRDIENLKRSVLTMAGIVEEAVYSATRSLQHRDAELARRVIEGDQEIGRFDNRVQEECLRVLALYAPVAVDLRQITCVLLISTDLERMGDQAVAIAQRAIELSRHLNCWTPPRLAHMTERTLRMVRKALDAFVAADAASARAVIRMAREVNHDHIAVLETVTAQIRRTPEWIDWGMALHSAVRHIERICDHATKIAENVVFIVEGKTVRHQPETVPNLPESALTQAG